jgi:hypothetical protein
MINEKIKLLLAVKVKLAFLFLAESRDSRSYISLSDKKLYHFINAYLFDRLNKLELHSLLEQEKLLDNQASMNINVHKLKEDLLKARTILNFPL